jgi:hypothetical protein
LPRFRTSPPSELDSRTSYESPFVTTKSPLSFERTSRHAMTRFARPLSVATRSDLDLDLAPSPAASLAFAFPSRKFLKMPIPFSPDFSGWNWHAVTSPFCTAAMNSPP